MFKKLGVLGIIVAAAALLQPAPAFAQDRYNRGNNYAYSGDGYRESYRHGQDFDRDHRGRQWREQERERSWREREWRERELWQRRDYRNYYAPGYYANPYNSRPY